MNVPNERSFQGLSKTCNLSLLSIPDTEKNAFKRSELLSESYIGNNQEPGNCISIFPAFVDHVSAALLLLATAAVAPVWVVIQLEAFLTPLLATGDGFAIDRTI